MTLLLHPHQALNRLTKSPLRQALLVLFFCALSMAIGFRMGSPRHSAQESAANLQISHDTRSGPGPAATHSPSSLQHDQGSTTLLTADAHGAGTPTTHAAMDWRQVASATPASAEATTGTAKNADMVSSPNVLRPVLNRAPPSNVVIPMAFRDVNLAAVGLSASQVANIDQMRSQFTQQVGASNNTTDPQYRSRWVNAQMQLDDQLRAFLGTEMYNQYQIHAAQASR